MDQLTVSVWTCKRCGHKWIPRGGMPKECPKCKSPLWNSERGAREVKMANSRKKRISADMEKLKSLVPRAEYGEIVAGICDDFRAFVGEEEYHAWLLGLMQSKK